MTNTLASIGIAAAAAMAQPVPIVLPEAPKIVRKVEYFLQSRRIRKRLEKKKLATSYQRMRQYLNRSQRPEGLHSDREYQLVNSMTNWQRNQWAKAKYPWNIIELQLYSNLRR